MGNKHTKQFIEDAIEGGFDLVALLKELGIRETYTVGIGQKYITVTTHQGNVKQLCSFEKILLSPKVWQAVGKTRGWKYPTSKDSNNQPNGEWVDKWVDFIVCLAEGKDIETALSIISK